MGTLYPNDIDPAVTLVKSPPGTMTLADHTAKHQDHYDAARAIQTALGKSGTTDESSLRQRVYRLEQARINVCRGIPEAGIGPVLPTNSASTNTTNLQAMIDFARLVGASTVFVFPGQAPGTVYPLNAISISSATANITFEGHGAGASVLSYRGSSAGAAFITFTGTETNGWGNGPGGRIWYSGLRNLALVNGGSQADSTALSFNACTHMVLENVNISDFRRHAIRARNLADCYWPNVGIFRCGSLNGNGGTNYRCIDYGSSGSGAGKWAVDRIQHIGWQVEDFGDGVLTAQDGDGYYVNKLAFAHCKFESSGSKDYVMGGNTTSGCVFYLKNTDTIVFTDCDFTLADLRTGQATLPACFDCDGWVTAQWHGASFNLGDGAVDNPFTYLWDIADAHSTIVHDGVVIGVDNAAAYPTNVVHFSAAARYAYYGCGWKGDPPASPPTWASGTTPTNLLSGGV